MHIVGGLLSLLVLGLTIYLPIRIILGRKNPILKWLQKEILSWERKNIINTEQGNSILQEYNLKRIDVGKKMDTVKIITLIGSIFLGLGVIFFVASNWQEIPKHIRTGILLGTTFITLYLGYFFSCENSRYPVLGKSLLFLSSLFWGGSIALICQIYHIPSSDNWLVVLLWAFPILPIVYFFDNKYTLVLTSALFVVWNFLYSSSNDVANYYYPVIVFILMLPMAKKFKVGQQMNIIGLLLAGFYCPFFKYEWLPLFISIGLLSCYLIKKEEKEYLYAASLSFVAWHITYFSIREISPNFYFLLPLATLFYLTYKEKSKLNLAINIMSLILWFHYTLYTYSKIFDNRYSFITTVIIQSAIGIILYIIGISHRNKEMGSPYKIFGYTTAFGCTYLLSFKKMLLNNTVYSKLFFWMSLLLMFIAVVLLIGKFLKNYFNTKSAKWELLALLSVIISNLFILMNPYLILFDTVVANAVLVVFAVVNIFYGVEEENPAIFNSGIAIFVLFVITRYIDIFWELKEKSWFFIIGGLFMIIGGMYLEKQRRKVLEKMNK
ncbi:MAG: DUF2157 domain-containing protein [Elusimicrobia bacterium]|nr:DUF2157 domain-containing protein [Elusimicrobiota bacterium]